MTRVLDYNASVTRRVEVTHGLDIFQVELDEPLDAFEPGQYVTIGLNRPTDDPNDTRPLSVLRPMTIASSPLETKTLEFYVQHVSKPESRLPLTHLMWELREGVRMYVRPSVTGRFTAKETYGELNGRKLLMVANGTGIAPFLSMLRAKTHTDPDINLADHVLVQEVCNPNYLSHREEIEQWVTHNQLMFIPTMSRPHESTEWPGQIGRADQLFSPDKIKTTEGLGNLSITPARSVVLVCGLANTIASTVQNLLVRGFVPEHRRVRKLLEVEADHPTSIFYEQYDALPLLDFKDESLIASLRQKWISCQAA